MRFYVPQIEGKYTRSKKQHILLFGFYVAVFFVVCSLACKPKALLELTSTCPGQPLLLSLA